MTNDEAKRVIAALRTSEDQFGYEPHFAKFVGDRN
jgi:hypothetical protein